MKLTTWDRRLLAVCWLLWMGVFTSYLCGPHAVRASGPALVQAKFNQTTSGSTDAVTMTSAISAGNLIVVSVGGSSSQTVSSITDNGSTANTYTQVPSCYGTDGGGRWVDIWYAKNSLAGATTVTVTFSGTSKQNVQVYEVSGIDTANPIDATCVHGGSTTGTVDTGPSITTTSANDFLAAAARTSGNGVTSENDATFTLDTGNGSGGESHAIVSSTGTYTPKWNDSAATTFVAAVASFKAPSGGGTLAAPSISPATGAYSTPQTITLTDNSGQSATLCYTTNGTTPTATTAGTCDQNTYSAPFSQALPATVEAIATKAGFTNSSVTSTSYIVAGSAPSLSLANQTGTDNMTFSAAGGAVTNPNLYVYLNQPSGTFGGAHDCLAVVAYANSTLFTIGTPSDNVGGDTYTAISGASGTQNSIAIKSWIVYGVPAGVVKITVPMTGTTSSTTPTYFGGWAQEFYNGCTAVGGSGFLAFTANGAANNLTLSSAPYSGDTVAAYAVDTQFPGTSSSCIGNTITFTAGWTPMGDSPCYGKAAEENSSTTSTSVPITFAGTDKIAMVAFEIEQGPAGTAPSGMYIDHEQADQDASGSASVTNPFPSTGNLFVALFNTNTTQSVSSISLANSGSPTTNTSCGPIHNTGNSAELVQIPYAYGATLSPTTSITFTLTAASTGINPEFLSITGAAASPFVQCTAGVTGNQTTSGNTTTDTITPLATGHFLVNELAVDYHTMTGLVADGNGHTPLFLSAVDSAADNVGPSCNFGSPASTLAGDNGYAILKTANTTATTFIYTGTQTTGSCTTSPAGVQWWSALTAEFKPAPTGGAVSIPMVY